MQNLAKLTACFLLASSLLLGTVARSQVLNDLTDAESASAVFVDPLGRPTTVETGAFGEVVSATDVDGEAVRIQRAESGEPLSVTRTNGAVARRTFDNFGNVLTLSEQTLDGVATFSYDTTFSRPTRITDALNGQIQIDYDSNGNPLRLISPMGHEYTATFAAQGLLSSLRFPEGNEFNFAYNAQRLPTSVTVGTGPGARSQDNTYDNAGYLASITDALGGLYTIDYDMMGRITQLVTADVREISFTYDAIGNLASFTPPGREAYTYTYNSVGVMTEESYPVVAGGGTNSTIYNFNLARQWTSVVRADGIELFYDYDAVGRHVQTRLPNGNYDYSFDSITGQLIGSTSPYGVTQTYGYNNEIPISVSWSGAVSGSVSFSYARNGYVSAIDIAGTEYTFTRNADVELIAVDGLQLTYDANRQPTSATLGVVTENFEYNQFLELSRHTVVAGNVTLYDVQYTRDDLGQITQKTEVIEGTTTSLMYTYDNGRRLTGVAINNAAPVQYSYDVNDNRVDGGASLDAQDRLLSANGISYEHNAHGERIGKTDGADVTNYQYDAQGNMIGATFPDGTSVSYSLDGEFRRVAKQVNGASVAGWLYGDYFNPVAQLDNSNTVTQRYVYAAREIVPSFIDTQGGRYRVIADNLGSVRLIIDSQTGAVVQRIDYDAWGLISSDTNPGFQPFGFAGGLHDRDTGLVQLGFREYDPATARWLRRDPIGVLGGQYNLYAYAGNDPVNRVDPTGLKGFDPDDPALTAVSELGKKLAGDKAVDMFDELVVSKIISHVAKNGLAGPLSQIDAAATAGGAPFGLAIARYQGFKRGENPYSPSDNTDAYAGFLFASMVEEAYLAKRNCRDVDPDNWAIRHVERLKELGKTYNNDEGRDSYRESLPSWLEWLW